MNASVGDVLFAKPEWMFQLLLALLGVVPAMVLVFVATRTGSQARDRQVALATRLGARRRHRVVIGCGEAGPAVLVGALPALILVLFAAWAEVRLPAVGYLLPSADLRDHVWLLVGTWLLGILVVLAALVLLDGVVVSRSRRLRPLGIRRSPVRTAALFPVMVCVAIQAPRLFEPGTPPFLLANYVGIIGTLLTVPAAIGLVVARFGLGLARLARRGSLAGTLLAGRWLAANAGAVARIAAGIVAAIGLLVQAQVWFGFLGTPAQRAQVTHQRIGDSVQILGLPQGTTPQQLTALFQSLSGTAEPVRLVRDGFAGAGVVRIVGTCPALLSLHLSCPEVDSLLSHAIVGRDPRLGELLNTYASTMSTVTVRMGDPARVEHTPDAASAIALISPVGKPLSSAMIEKMAYRIVPGPTTAYPIGGMWLLGAAVSADQGRWLLLIGVVGVFLLTTAFGIIGLGEFSRWSCRLAPVAVLAGNRRVAVTSAAWTVFLPIAAAGGIGIGLAWWLALPIVDTGFSRFCVPLIQACAAAVVTLAILFWVTAVRAASHQFGKWTPGID